MYYCVYMSTASNPLPDHELMNIKQKSKTESEKFGVTGLLVFHRNTFIHYYEGDKAAVSKMLASVTKDKRHKGVSLVGEGQVEARQFNNASMELRVLDKDPLFTPEELGTDGAGVKKSMNNS